VVRLKIKNVPGMLAKVAACIGDAGGNIGAIDTPEISASVITRDITVSALDEEHGRRIVDAMSAIPDVSVVSASSVVLLAHLGGKIEVTAKRPLKTRRDLSILYTPGVAEVSMAVHEQPWRAYSFTMKGNTVAVVTDGTAVLGLEIGPEAALPRRAAVLFKEFAGVDAIPICLNTKDPEEIIRAVKYIAPGFGGINLEDISAPRCFQIEERLKAELDIPVFHDDQHGTAVVIIAALLNALKIVGKRLEDLKIVFSGVGAAGTAMTKSPMGAMNIIGCGQDWGLYRGVRAFMNVMKEWYAQNTNPEGFAARLRLLCGERTCSSGSPAPGFCPRQP
jgi:malate dehydrogenase (oxaloacetate-decarboxylating)